MLVLINTFTITASPEEFERVFTQTAEFMRAQPGFRSYRLVRSAEDPQVYVNIAEWDDRSSLMAIADSAEMTRHRAEITTVATPHPRMYLPVTEAGPVAAP